MHGNGRPHPLQKLNQYVFQMLNSHNWINLLLLWMHTHIHKNNLIPHLFEILFKSNWRMPGHNHAMICVSYEWRLISKTFLFFFFFELLEFYESWNLIDRDENWACLGMSDQNHAKSLLNLLAQRISSHTKKSSSELTYFLWDIVIWKILQSQERFGP